MDSLKKLIERSLTHLRKQISRHFWSTHLPAQCIHGILQARMLQWVAIPFSKGSSQPRDGTRDSCIAGRFFTGCATRDALVPISAISLSEASWRTSMWWLWPLSWSVDLFVCFFKSVKFCFSFQNSSVQIFFPVQSNAATLNKISPNFHSSLRKSQTGLIQFSETKTV